MRHSASLRRMMVLLVVAAVSCFSNNRANAEDHQLDLPSFGISVPFPDGYQRSLEKNTSQVFKFEILDASGTSQHLITLQLAKPPVGGNAESLAKSMSHGAVLKPRKWGGLDAFEFAGDPKAAKNDWYNAENITVDHDGYAWLLTYAAVPGHEESKGFDQVIDGTKWSPRKPLLESVRSRGQAVKLQGNILCDLPDPFRPESTSDGQQMFVAMDLAGQKTTMRVVHLVEKADSDETLANLTLYLPIQTDKPVNWDKSTDGHRALSDAIHLPDKGDMACIVMLSDDKKLVHRFALTVIPGTNDQKLVKSLAKELFESLALPK